MRLVLLLLVALLLAGCPVSDKYDDRGVPKTLAFQVSLYEDIVRWGDLRKIHAFSKPMKEGEEPQPVSGMQALQNVRVTSYEASTPRELSPWRWGQNAVINYVLVDRQVVKTVLDAQIWMSEDEGKTWYRSNPPPRFQ